MNKKFVASFMLVAALIGCQACSNDSKESDEASSSNNVKEPVNIYLDTATKRVNNFLITRSTISSELAKDNGYHFNIALRFSNDSGSNVPLRLSGNCVLTRESTGEEVLVPISNSFEPTDEMISMISWTQYRYPSVYDLTIEGHSVTDITKEHYSLSFEANLQKVVLHLYDTPEEFREEWTVTYKVNQKTVITEKVKDKDRITKKFIYDSPDHQKYCDSWYEEASLKTSFNFWNPIRSSVTLYGEARSVWEASYEYPAQYATLLSTVHIPEDKVLVVPETYRDKQVIIGEKLIAAYDEAIVRKVYVPKGIHAIERNNFKSANVTVYFEGSESEWRNLLVDPSDSIVSNVVFNTPSPF